MKQVWGFIREVGQTLIFALILTFVLRTYVVEAREIPTGSMQPTLEIGDKLMVEKITYRFAEIKRGDIVVFAPPPEAQDEDIKLDWIKRVIGLPGDTIEVSHGKVFVNGDPQNEPYIAQEPAYVFSPVVVPEGTVFVMGDNRNNSRDSTEWGVLPAANIKGRAFLRFWPWDRLGSLAGSD